MNMNIGSMLGVALVGMVTAVITGRTVRVLVVLLLQKLADRKSNPIAEKLVDDIRKDLGVNPDDLPTVTKKDETNGKQ